MSVRLGMVVMLFLSACRASGDRSLELSPPTTVASDERFIFSVPPVVAPSSTVTVVAWETDRDSDEVDARIHARVFGRDGKPAGDTLRVAAGHHPAVSVIEDHVVVAWARSTVTGDELDYAILPEPAAPVSVPTFVIDGSPKLGGIGAVMNVAGCGRDGSINILEDLLHARVTSIAHGRNKCLGLTWVVSGDHMLLVAQYEFPSTEVFAKSSAGWVSVAFYPGICAPLPDADQRCHGLAPWQRSELVKTRTGVLELLVEPTHTYGTPAGRLIATGMDAHLGAASKSVTVLPSYRFQFSAVAADDKSDDVLMAYFEDHRLILRKITNSP